MLLSPKAFILGGGVSKKLEKFNPQFTVDVPVYASEFLNAAGVIGAAYYASQELKK